MHLVSKKWLVSLLTRLVVIVIIAKAIALGLVWFLPSEGVSFHKESSTQPEYHRYSIKGMIVPAKKTTKTSTAAVSTGLQISSLILKGLYGSKEKGFVIVALKSSPKKTEVIGVGETFSGYKLARINPESAVFERSGKEYTLPIENLKPLPAVRVKAPEESDAPKPVSRDDINRYAKNVDQIWRDISIAEVKKNGKIKGFKVTRIKSGTPFARLGLKKGDIIIKANNKVLKSYADALDIYKKIDKLQALELVVLRNNQEKEILYEIH